MYFPKRLPQLPWLNIRSLRATKSYAEKAVKLFNQILYYKNTPGALEPKFREGFVAKGHSFCMILIDTAARIREAINDPVLTRQIDESIAELRRDFMKPEFKAILETVGPDGESSIRFRAGPSIRAIPSRLPGSSSKRPNTGTGTRS